MSGKSSKSGKCHTLYTHTKTAPTGNPHRRGLSSVEKVTGATSRPRRRDSRRGWWCLLTSRRSNRRSSIRPSTQSRRFSPWRRCRGSSTTGRCPHPDTTSRTPCRPAIEIVCFAVDYAQAVPGHLPCIRVKVVPGAADLLPVHLPGAGAGVEIVPGAVQFEPSGLEITAFIEIVLLAVDLLPAFYFDAVFVVDTAGRKIFPAI